MTKSELLVDIESKNFIQALVGESELKETKPNGDKWYVQNVREVTGACCTYRNINFYVINEGEDGESAYYKETEPKPLIQLKS